MEWKDFVSKDPGVLLSEKRVGALLNDFFSNDHLKVNLMKSAYAIGIVTETRSGASFDNVTVSRWTKRMVNDYGISAQNARWAIDTWLPALTPQILQGLNEAEKRKQEETEEQRREKEETVKNTDRQREIDNEQSVYAILNNREDYERYYINPYLEYTEEYIYIPCGFGRGDNGFLIYGIKKEKICTHPDANVFALIYNYLVRNSVMTETDIPLLLKNVDTLYEFNYQTVFRLAIILLMMVRHNRTKDGAVLIDYQEDKESLQFAVRMINNYAALFCRLMGIAPVHITVKNGKGGIPVSLLKKTNGVFASDNRDILSNARELWYGRKINYHLTKDNLTDVEYLLKEISDFDGFKEGQYSALCDMLACKDHAVCIMPTGSGKSLIYYLASLLQPLPLFIVSPTDILISDQIRNLKRFHRIDNVAHLQLTDGNNFANWDVCNSLNYLTPETFQNRNLLVRFRYINDGTKLTGKREDKIAYGALVSYVVLDEIHCLSNWGHDFRPEYLMLSKYLIKFFDRVVFLGFTATANYTVVEDVRKQLDIPMDNFFSPVSFEHFNVDYSFRALRTEEDMLQETKTITESILARNERTIVFTKNDETSQKVAQAIGWEADIFSKEDPSSYYHFAAGDSKVLVAGDELGIGINLPNVRNVIHFGLPLSKNEFVQEIGRAGRANEKVHAFVLYLEPNSENAPDGTLRRGPVHHTVKSLTGVSNDYSMIYQKLTNGVSTEDELCSQLLSVYRNYVKKDPVLTEELYSLENVERAKQYLYMLYLTGYLRDWYSSSMTADGTGIKIVVDIDSVDTESYRNNPNKMLNRMKECMCDYFLQMGGDRESIAKVKRTKDPEEIIRVFVHWYYEKYLFHHKEQFLDFLDFISVNKEGNRDKITEDIKEFFTLPFAKLKSDEALYSEMLVKDVMAKVSAGMGKNALANLERINSNRYSLKLDLALFLGRLRMDDIFSESRLERIVPHLSKDEKRALVNTLSMMYTSCSTNAKINILNYLERNGEDLHIDFMDFLDKTYHNSPKDILYYGIIANKLNKCFAATGRNLYV